MSAPELTVLLVEDDADLRLGCEQALQLAGIAVEAVGSAEAAMRHLAPAWPGIVVTDLRLPGADGLALLRHCRTLDEELPVAIITGHGDVGVAVEAMRAGAYDFIEKPFSSDMLVEMARRALDKRALTLEVGQLRQRLAQLEGLAHRLVGDSPAMRQVRALIESVADSQVDVLILGETGTGKELVARALHDFSRRRAAPFVALNCGGMPDTLLDSELFGHEAGAFTGAAKRRIGKIEHAQGGTLFLDELETMPMAMQIKLLRFLQERKLERLGSNQPLAVDCRVVAAAKEDLPARLADQRFRADLYYRLNVVCIALPPLRERREDLPMLLELFLGQAAARYERPMPAVAAATLHELAAHDWPGNLRELRNRADAMVLGVPAAPTGAEGSGTTTLAEAVERYERGLIVAELQRCGGSLSRAAEALGTPKTTLHDKIRKHGITLRG